MAVRDYAKERYERLKAEGKCVLCKAELNPGCGQLKCDACRAKVNAKQRKVRRERVEDGICPVCHGAAIVAHNRCTSCHEKHREVVRRQREKYIQDGLCRCGSARTSGFRLCEKCRSDQQRALKSRVQDRSASGLCPCGKPSAPEHKYCADCLAVAHVRRANLRRAVFEHYGLACACCGEATFEFLEIDHVNNDGAAHRKELQGRSIYRWLKVNGFPEGFQTLCSNCNVAKFRHGGICPHQRARESATAEGTIQ
jgi:hypothetical protein